MTDGDERLTIDELARRVGMTARNIRAHQTRGLLQAPVLRGRTGYYDRRHVERLRLIQRMQDEGLNLGAISWLLGAGEEGGDVRLLMRAVLEPFANEPPVLAERAELEHRLGGPLEPEVIDRAVRLGVVEIVDETTVRVLLPPVVRRSEELVALGVPIAAQLDVLETLDRQVGAVATAFVGLARSHLLGPLSERAVADPDIGQVREAVEQLRSIATEVLLAVFQRAMTERIERTLADYVGELPGPAGAEAS